MNIHIQEDNTGYAPKDCRFTAYDDDTYDWAPDQRRASSVGYGATREEAVADLLEIMEAEDEITADEMTMLLAAHGAKAPYRSGLR